MRTSPSGERGGRRRREGGGGREEEGEGGGGGGRRRRREEEEGGGGGGGRRREEEEERRRDEKGGGEGGAGEEGDREWSVILPSLIPRSCPPSVMKKKWEGLVYHVSVDCVWTHCMGAREGGKGRRSVQSVKRWLPCDVYSPSHPPHPHEDREGGRERRFRS